MGDNNFRILMPGNNPIGYVDSFFLDNAKELLTYNLIGCIDAQTNTKLPGVFLAPPIKPDKRLLELLSLAMTDLSIELQCEEGPEEVAIQVVIQKRNLDSTRLGINFNSTLQQFESFLSLMSAAGRCWLVWRGEGFQFFASFDPETNMVENSAFELLQ